MKGQILASADIEEDTTLDSIILLTIEPHFAFAYWNISSTTMEEVAKHVGPESRLVLRLYDVSDGNAPDSASYTDIEVFDRLGNWYIKLDYPEQALAVDIGLKDNTGRYCTISRTFAVKLPPPTAGTSSWESIDEIPLLDATGELDGEPQVANHALLKQILGPHFYSLLLSGNFESIIGSSAEAVFQDISSLK